MKQYTIEFTEEQLNIVLGALGEMPAKMSMGVIQLIHQQVRQQNAPPPSVLSSITAAASRPVAAEGCGE